jgi:hypothetical protein
MIVPSWARTSGAAPRSFGAKEEKTWAFDMTKLDNFKSRIGEDSRGY